MIRPIAAIAALAALSTTGLGQGQPRRAIVDMHLHTSPWRPSRTPAEDSIAIEQQQRAVLDSLDRYNVVLAIASGDYGIATRWAQAAPGRVLAAAGFPCENGRMPNGGRRCFSSGAVLPDTAWLRGEYRAGRLAALGEILSQYAGLPPSDASLEPVWALAEQLDLPVAIHMGMGPPGGAAYPGGVCGRDPCAPNYRMALSDPMLLEPVLRRHPRLRVYIMHAGWPYLDQLIGLMYAHPQVYADVAAWWAAMPREEFHSNLRRLVRAGYGKRLMYGSDLDEMGKAVQAIEEAPYLTEEQKNDIFHDNAARFLRRPAIGTRNGVPR
jgi:uncharacterized protein